MDFEAFFKSELDSLHQEGRYRVFAGANGVFRHRGMEEALASSWSPEAVTTAEVNPGDMLADIHASADYRTNLVRVMAKRAVQAAG
jgi:Aerobic-type carbon monoxide dehydrogenase, middle subunit CoxM/CutM homologs